MTPDELTRLKALCDAATPRPWAAVTMAKAWSKDDVRDPERFVLIEVCEDDPPFAEFDEPDDAKLAAEAVNALPALIADAERMREALQYYAESPPRGEYLIVDRNREFLSDMADWGDKARAALEAPNVR